MPPLRIVSLISSATEMLYALGLGDNVVAVSHECDWPPEITKKPRATTSNIDASRPSGEIDVQVRSKLAAGEPLYGIDGDLIAALRPGLIVTQAQCDVCAVRLDDVRAMIATRPELQATQLVSLQPNRLDEIFEDVLRVGEATGAAAAAEDFVAELKARVARVRQNVARQLQSQPRRRVAIIEWTEPLMLAGNWTPELVEIAGGYCPLAIAGEHSRYHNWSEVAAFDPEAIVVAPCGFDLQRAILEARPLQRLPGWQDTSAARAGRIFALDGNAYLNRSGPRIVDTLEILAELFWGDNVPDAACLLTDDAT
jgi:iron complex transport system substrate-binding protein